MGDVVTKRCVISEAMSDFRSSQLTYACSFVAAATLYSPDPHRWRIRASVVERLPPIQCRICR